MKRFFLYMLAFLVTLTAVSRAEVFIKCDHISGNLDKEIISKLEYIHLGEDVLTYRNINGKKFSYYWDKKEQKFYYSRPYKIRVQDYKIYYIYNGVKTVSAKIDRETGILLFSTNKFQCSKIKKSDLPIIKVEQKF